MYNHLGVLKKSPETAVRGCSSRLWDFLVGTYLQRDRLQVKTSMISRCVTLDGPIIFSKTISEYFPFHFTFSFYISNAISSVIKGHLLTEKTQDIQWLFPSGVLQIWSKFTGEHTCRKIISTKIQCNFIEITLRLEVLL